MIRYSARSAALTLLALTIGCGGEPDATLELVAYGTEPPWTIRVWSDSLVLTLEGDHAAHAFETRRSDDDGAYETAAGATTLRLERSETDCPEPGRSGRSVTLSFASQTYAGCGREPAFPISRVRDAGDAFTAAVPDGWSAVTESRGDTTAVTWRPAEGQAELTLIALSIDGGYSQEALIELAESFARARHPDLAPQRDETLARTPNAIRLPFSGAAGDEPVRVVVDIEQEPGRLRLLGLYAPADDAVWEEETLLLGGFRWLAPSALPPEAEPPAAES